MAEMDQCYCGLPLRTPPDGVRWWRPGEDVEPDEQIVPAVVRHGELPEMRRFVRCPSGWLERGRLAAGNTRLVPWSEIGRCAAGVAHPVTELGL